ncbi:MAG: hypothetical protein GF329_21785 [Candidatus Lokiarchaeota archaeon]|nr:hypothetical protein [Candidatus Lokiarchaeota archaeon]
MVENIAILRSKLGRIITLHGHQTSLSQYGSGRGWGVEAGRKLKTNLEKEYYTEVKLLPEDILIVGHCHVVYYDHTAKIYSPGCWIGNYENRNVGWYILIDDESFDEPEEGIQLKRINKNYRRTCECGYKYLSNDDLYCPKCKKKTTPICARRGCNRPLRGEDLRTCKKCKTPDFHFYC